MSVLQTHNNVSQAGTTGEPKVVMLSHDNVSARMYIYTCILHVHVYMYEVFAEYCSLSSTAAHLVS